MLKVSNVDIIISCKILQTLEINEYNLLKFCCNWLDTQHKIKTNVPGFKLKFLSVKFHKRWQIPHVLLQMN